MKVLIIFFWSVFIANFAYGQTGWAKLVKDGYGAGESISVDKSGNVYVAGTFATYADFDGIRINDNSGKQKTCLAKFTSNGKIEWARKVGDDSLDLLYSVKVDHDNKVYVSGKYIEETDSGKFLSAGLYISKYNSDGNLEWSKKIPGYLWGADIGIDSKNNVYLIGSFGGRVTFDSLTLFGPEDLFIVKLHPDALVEWAIQSAGIDNHRAYGISVSIDSYDNIYVTGTFDSTLSIGNYNLKSIGGRDIFIGKFRPDGIADWIKGIGGEGDELVGSLRNDIFGNFFLTGSFEDAVDFDSIKLQSKGIGDIYIAKFTSEGKIIWAKSAGGIHDEGGAGVTTDFYGNAYLTGTTHDSSDFGGIKLSTNHGLFVARYDINGNCTWVKNVQGLNGSGGEAIVSDTNGDIYVTGFFMGTGKFADTVLTDTTYARQDIFLWKIVNSSGSGVLSNKNIFKKNISPNPAWNSIHYNFNLTTSGKIELSIVNLHGNPVAAFHLGELSSGEHSFDFNVASLSQGSYFIVLRTPTSTEFQKLIISR